MSLLLKTARATVRIALLNAAEQLIAKLHLHKAALQGAEAAGRLCSLVVGAHMVVDGVWSSR